MRLTSGRASLTAGLAAALLFGGGAAATRLAAQQAQQQGGINGTVTDRVSGAPLASVRVSVLNTNRSAFTNQQGKFFLQGLPVGTYQLQASLIGYGAATGSAAVTTGQNATVDFGLKAAAVSLDVVTVVTPAGEQRAREAGTATSNIDMPTITQNQTVTTFADAMSGRDAGVQVLQSGGTVGTGTRIRIRGQTSLSLSNEPVYYVDGVRVESGDNSLSIGTGGQAPSRINDINPEDIANVEVVKGPAASTLYGTQAANGVIRITTKRGLAGRTNWNLYSEVGTLNDRNKYPTNYFSWGRQPVTNAILQCLPISAAGGLCSIDSLTNYNVLMNPVTSINGTGYREQTGLQVSGGSEQVQYFISGEYEDEMGHIRMPSAEASRVAQERVVDALPSTQLRPNDVKKVSMRTNVQAQLRRNVDVALKTGLVMSDGRLPQNDNNVTGILPSGLFGRGFPGTRTIGGSAASSWGFSKPGEVFAILTSQDITRFTGSVNATWRPTPHITARATAGLDHTNRVDRQFQALDEGVFFSNFRSGRVADNRFSINQYTVDVNASGNYTLTPTLSSKTTVGFQFLKEFNFGVTANGQVLPPGGKTISGTSIRTAGEATAVTITLGAYIEQVLGYKDRLFLTGALRTDDNSSFGRNFSAVYYPKVQASWVVSDEPFFPRSFPVSNLRLRGAYGASGQQPGTTDAAQFYTPVTNTIRGVDTPGLSLASLGNPDLRPERSAELEVGFDAGLLNDAAHLEFTYYNKKTRDALVLVPLALSLGGPASQFINLGSVQNKGLEAVLNISTSLAQGVAMDVTLSGSHNSNKLITLGAGISPINAGNNTRQVPGYPIFGYWDRPIIGYKDINGDGILTSSEVFVGDTSVFLGYSIPRNEAAINLGFTLFHNRVRIGGQVDYRGGFMANNFTDYFRCTSSAANNCRAVNDPTVPFAEQARVVAARTPPFATAAGFIEDAEFVKFREVAFTYYATDAMARALHMSRLSLTVTGRNLGTITGYTGIDPEVNGGGQNDAPIDFLTQPPVQFWTFRVNMGF